LGAQAGVLLLQHYFGARCFVPRQVWPFEFVRYRTSSQIWLDPLWKNFQMFNFPTYGIQMLKWGWLIYNMELWRPLSHLRGWELKDWVWRKEPSHWWGASHACLFAQILSTLAFNFESLKFLLGSQCLDGVLMDPMGNVYNSLLVIFDMLLVKILSYLMEV
jgi:hypothetical protein